MAKYAGTGPAAPPTQPTGTAVPHQPAQAAPQTAVSQGNGVNPTQRYNGAQGD